MAQPMVGIESAPIIRSNRGVSLFAEETKMTSRKPANTDTTAAETVATETVAETPAQAETPATTAQDVATLVAQRKALDEAIRTAKAAMPKRDALELVIEHQEAHAADVIAKTKVVGRVKAGQSRAEAIAAVLELTGAWLEAEIPQE